MKLQQLKSLIEIVNHNLNVSSAAESLLTSQPSISKQIRALEEELGVTLFERSGKNFVRVTPVGKEILQHSHVIFNQINDIQAVAQEYSDPTRGQLIVSTAHHQTRYILPSIFKVFLERYPHVAISLHENQHEQVHTQILKGRCNFAITAQKPPVLNDIVALPCFRWQWCCVVPETHPLAQRQNIDVSELASYPLITYLPDSPAYQAVVSIYRYSGLKPWIRLTAIDASLIKSCVRLGGGVGFLDSTAIQVGDGLTPLKLNAPMLANTTEVVFRRRLFFRSYMYDFVQMFAPHLTRSIIDGAIECETQQEREAFIKQNCMPHIPN